MDTLLSLEHDGLIPVDMGNAIRVAIKKLSLELNISTTEAVAIVAASYGLKTSE